MKLTKTMLLKAAAILLIVGGTGAASAQGQDGCCDIGSCDTGCCETFGCDSGCDSGCDGCGLGCGAIGDCLSLGSCLNCFDCGDLIQTSDCCFDDFISPMINFVYFEDPRNLTEVRPIFVHHNVPNTLEGGAAAGGSVQLYAMQFRLALTDRLSLIAVKDGYIVDNTDGALDTLINSGWADITAGLKYNLIRDTCRGTLASVGFTYEIPVGSEGALQSVGDGEFHIFATGGQRLLDGNAHILSAIGYRFPVDNDVQSSAIHWSNHFDVRLSEQTYLFTEAAWWHWTDEAAAGPALGVAGQDLFNFNATGVEGNDLVTQNVGLKFKPRRNIEAGIAYEFPLTSFNDVIEDRIQAEMILRF